MSDLKNQRFADIVRELDDLLPTEGAILDWDYDGNMLANRLGYLRFGIALLKAADAPGQPVKGDEDMREMYLGMEALIRAENRWPISAFYRLEDPTAFGSTGPQQRRSNTVARIVLFGLCSAIVMLAGMGGVTLATWLEEGPSSRTIVGVAASVAVIALAVVGAKTVLSWLWKRFRACALRD